MNIMMEPMDFWKTLKKPIVAIAPMANVTDAAFRRMFVECGRPDVFWTEFVSVEGLLSKGKEKLLVDFWYHKREHPIVAQVFGSKPEQFEAVGPLIRELGFDGVDINMGCPDRGVEKSGGGAALIKNPKLAKEIIRALKKGVGDLPVSVKTRIGYTKDEIGTWIPALLEEDLAALTVHLRTRNEMSNVAAHWELAPKIVELRDRHAPQTLVLGNGDVNSLEDARARVRESGVDGAMIGRGIFGNPWLFSGKAPYIKEKLERMVKHTELFEELYCNPQDGIIKNFDVMKKHFKAYVSGFDGAKELRIKLMEADSAKEVRAIVGDFSEVVSLKDERRL
jgi:nifR3 family TIM-barrel protein